MEVKQKLATELAIEEIPNRSRIAPFNTTTLIKMYAIAPKKGTPKLSGFLKNNHQSPACTTHNGAQHRVYTKK